ncbi:glycosyltransferase family A protein [Cytophagaceae bacterium ABcell3]|nr:glycosyltransferase family A protein [Cytophagaceae bacterium ABcell3]
MKEYFISFFTISMNRLHHLKKTLPANIKDNNEYNNLEFVILDYNSDDGMEEWVKNELGTYLDSGKVKFFRTEEPEFFNRSHSRNMAVNLCSGELICNVDADNFTGQGFASFLNAEFNKDSNIVVNSNFHGEYMPYKDAFGRFGAWRSDFHKVGGYDESMTSYGYEDIDLYERLVMMGRKEVKIKNFDFLRSISHGNEDRLEQEHFNKNLDRFYVAYDIGSTKVIFLYKDGTFESGTLNEKHEFYPGLFTIEGGVWDKGRWKEESSFLMLNFSIGREEKLFTDNQGLCYLLKKPEIRLTFFKVEDSNFLENVKSSYSIVTNASKYQKNMNERSLWVNTEGYGRGTVFGSQSMKVVKEPAKKDSKGKVSSEFTINQF